MHQHILESWRLQPGPDANMMTMPPSPQSRNFHFVYPYQLYRGISYCARHTKSPKTPTIDISITNRALIRV